MFTIFGAAGLQSFTVLAGFLAAIGVAMAILSFRRHGRIGPAGGWRILLLALPLLILATAMAPSQWDELTNWLQNARYLVEHDAFPSTNLPKSPSLLPAYPYGLPFIIFFASRITGQMVENAGALFNHLLFLSYGLLLARLAATIVKAEDVNAPRDDEIRGVNMGWELCALAGILVTCTNPTFVQRLLLSSYSDAATTITIGFACVFAWLMLNNLTHGNQSAARTNAWQIGLMLTAAIGLKQVNLVFLIALCMTVLLIAARDPNIGWRSVCKLGPYAVVLPLIVYGAWRIHVGLHLSGGEFSFRPFSGWYINLIPDIVARMALVASKKGVYFGIMLVAVILCLRTIWRPRTAFERLTALTAGMFIAYNCFLLLSYVGAFGRGEALRAASFWRYSTHLGGVCMLFITYSSALLWRKYIRRPPPRAVVGFCIVLILALPMAVGKKLRFDLDPGYAYARSTASDISKILSPNDQILLIDPLEDEGYLVNMRYQLHGSASIVSEITVWARPTAKSIRQLTASKNPSHIWIFSAESVVTNALGVSLPQGNSYLLAQDKKKWSVIKKWPHPAPRYKAKPPTEIH
jgi:hypothetical protein